MFSLRLDYEMLFLFIVGKAVEIQRFDKIKYPNAFLLCMALPKRLYSS